MEIVRLTTPGLGDSTYLFHHDGIGMLVDPQRDVGRFLDAAERADASIRWVVDTHLHNDYVSGGRDAARLAGAELVLPASAGAVFDHTPAFHHEDLTYGGITVRPIHTPGHTPEHVSYLILTDAEPVALFSGGSLLVGSAGRTDLLGERRARQLAKLQFLTLRRLAALPDQVGLYPTHGRGSFCAASAAGHDVSTIGVEKRTNPVLACTDVDEFVDGQLAGLEPYPSYYARMGPINLQGPEPLPDFDVPELDVDEFEARSGDAQVVDARPRGEFAAGHIPGSLGIELREDFATWVGWLVPFDSPILLVLNSDQEAGEALTQLARVGFDHVTGILRGTDRWRHRGRPLAAYPVVAVSDCIADRLGDHPVQLLDVRAPSEWEQGHLPGSMYRYLPDLVQGPPDGLDRSAPVWVICATGYRATAAAGLLEREGFRPVVVVGGGVDDVLRMGADPSC